MHRRRWSILGFFFVIGATAFWPRKEYKVAVPQNTVLLAAKGNALWYNRPHAVIFDGAAWVGYMTDQREVKVARVSAGKTTKEFTLFRWHLLDDHGAPALAAVDDASGFKRLFFCSASQSDLYQYIGF